MWEIVGENGMTEVMDSSKQTSSINAKPLMFSGLTAVSIDPKGRITIPSQYRDRILEHEHGRLVVTIDTEDRCLLMYPQSQWLQILDKLEQLPTFHRASRRIKRLLIGHAVELELDRQGRVLLPQILRDYAGVDKTVMVVGQGKKFELWGENQWQLGRDSWLAEDLGGDDEPMPPELMTLTL